MSSDVEENGAPPPPADVQAVSAKPTYKIAFWLEEAWDLFKPRWRELTTLQLISIAAAALPQYLINRIWGPHTIQRGNLTLQLPYNEPLCSMLSFLASAAISMPFIIGIAAVVLNYARSENIEWNLIWTGFRKWGICLLVAIFPMGLVSIPRPHLPHMQFYIFSVLVVIGIIIGMAIITWYEFLVLSVADGRTSYFDALKRSYRAVMVSFFKAILLALVYMLIGVSGVIICGVGAIFTGALAEVMIAVAYNDLARPVAAVSEADGQHGGMD